MPTSRQVAQSWRPPAWLLLPDRPCKARQWHCRSLQEASLIARAASSGLQAMQLLLLLPGSLRNTSLSSSRRA